jgi:crotonobetainyl-CoA:carnitine CoA-transferase CaiB-like acyl-CoA transferase
VTAPNQTFATADGYLNIAVVSDRHFQDLCRALQIDDLATDDRFATNAGRMANRVELAASISAVLSRENTSHWVEVIGSTGVPAGRVLGLPEVFADEQVLHNEMLVEVEHRRAGKVKLQGSPLRIDHAVARAPGPPPMLGEHTREILLGLGWTAERVDELARTGIIVTA